MRTAVDEQHPLFLNTKRNKKKNKKNDSNNNNNTIDKPRSLIIIVIILNKNAAVIMRKNCLRPNSHGLDDFLPLNIAGGPNTIISVVVLQQLAATVAGGRVDPFDCSKIVILFLS